MHTARIGLVSALFVLFVASATAQPEPTFYEIRCEKYGNEKHPILWRASSQEVIEIDESVTPTYGRPKVTHYVNPRFGPTQQSETSTSFRYTFQSAWADNPALPKRIDFNIGDLGAHAMLKFVAKPMSSSGNFQPMIEKLGASLNSDGFLQSAHILYFSDCKLKERQ